MRPSFNTAGPCIPGEHYMLPPGDRLGRVLTLIEEGKYFTLHAGRQTGKTTSAQWLVEHYNSGEQVRALWVDIQTAREQPNPAEAFRTVLNKLDMAVARALPDLDARPGARACSRILRPPCSVTCTTSRRAAPARSWC